MPHIPTDKPNHLLGIGDLESLQPALNWALIRLIARIQPDAHVMAFYSPVKAI